MNILSICGYAILSLVIVVLLKTYNSSLSNHLTAVAVIVITTVTVNSLIPVVSYVKELGATVKNGEPIIKMSLKAAGTALLCQVVSELCTSNGERNLATAVENAGDVAILLQALPILKNLITELLGLLK